MVSLGKMLLIGGVGVVGLMALNSATGNEQAPAYISGEGASGSSGMATQDSAYNQGSTPGSMPFVVNFNPSSTSTPSTPEETGSKKASSVSAPMSTSYGTAFVDENGKVVGGYDNITLQSFTGETAPSSKKTTKTTTTEFKPDYAGQMMSTPKPTIQPIIKQDPFISVNSQGFRSPLQTLSGGFLDTKKSKKVLA